jgi:hypothetical protein
MGIGGSLQDEIFAWLPSWALNPLPASFADTGSSTAQAAVAIGYLVFLVLLASIAYAVWRLHDVRISISAHIALNGFGWATNIAPALLSR